MKLVRSQILYLRGLIDSVIQQYMIWFFKHTLVPMLWNSVELIIAKAGARYTKEAPCINGNLEPRNVCIKVDNPVMRRTVETTLAVSSCKVHNISKNIDMASIYIFCFPKLIYPFYYWYILLITYIASTHCRNYYQWNKDNRARNWEVVLNSIKD